jgi:hypothetical protein
MGQLQDFTGEKFYPWVITFRATDNTSKTSKGRWWGRCLVCGNTRSIATQSLQANNVGGCKICGAKKKDREVTNGS